PRGHRRARPLRGRGRGVRRRPALPPRPARAPPRRLAGRRARGDGVLVPHPRPQPALGAAVSESVESAPAAIDLKGVIKRFGKERVLDGVDFEAPTGGITVLLGPSGAGKTVTIKHVLGLFRPTSGFVRVEGRNLSELDDDELNELRRRMSAVLQGTLPFSCGLFFSLDVFENVAFPLRERNRWSEERIEEVTMARLGEVGMRDQARLMPDQLSS